jgi:hypothetical protein
MRRLCHPDLTRLIAGGTDARTLESPFVDGATYTPPLAPPPQPRPPPQRLKKYTIVHI